MNTILTTVLSLEDDTPTWTEVIGLLIQGPKDQWEQVLVEWAEEVLQKSREAGIDTEADNYTLLLIKMPCGETINFRTLDDIQRSTVPCPCGDPTHYLIMYSEVE